MRFSMKLLRGKDESVIGTVNEKRSGTVMIRTEF